MSLHDSEGKKQLAPHATAEGSGSPTEKPRTLRERFRGALRAVVETLHPSRGAWAEELGQHCRINGVNVPRGTQITFRGEAGWTIGGRQDSGKIQIIKERPGNNAELRNITEAEIVAENPELFQ